MQNSPSTEICQRIAQVRTEVAGRRGKSSFAKQLGLSPSTYDYYESARIPPAGVLVRIADIGGVDLRWLLTGETGREPAISADHPVLQRAAAMLGGHPNAAAPLAAFLDILTESLRFPAKSEAAGEKTPPAAELTTAPRASKAGSAKEAWIPILGRTAAGVPQFWTSEDETAGLVTLDRIVARHARRSARQVHSATASAESPGEDMTVQIITLKSPDKTGVGEFVASGEIKSRFPDAFAVRLDGESMMPDLRHSDLVLLSPSAQAVDGRPAVVQLARQIGVTCKLYRRSGDRVFLVPINEQYPPQSFPADQVIWALQVLARVRP